jgi:S-DNA-T family DNA segregation ATPase FtsK/SpoIIIE
MIVPACLLPGWFAVTSAVSRVDKAFQSLPIRYSPEYGLPRWNVRGKYPLKKKVLEISAAGLSAQDFEDHMDKISSRLCEPIREISKPDAKKSVILVELGESRIPNRLSHDDLPWDSLKQGQFFIGIGENGLITLSLTDMVHLLVAGTTGMGKTAFEKQLLTTILGRTRLAHALVLDMKGGTDFHQFKTLPNFEIAIEPKTIVTAIDQAINLVNLRKKYLAYKKKEHWDQIPHKELESDPLFSELPIGHVIIVIDELAELVFQMETKKQADELQKKLSTFPRLSRSTSVHLIVGTQRPDKRILDGQSKDNMVTALCFSVPSVSASSLVVGDKSASTLGNHRGRAVYRNSGNQVIQTPYLDRSEIDAILSPAVQRLQHSKYNRKINGAPLVRDGEIVKKIETVMG